MDRSPMAPHDAMVKALQEVVSQTLGAAVEISSLARMPGGSSRETWGFTATPASGEAQRLVLRRDPAGTPSSGIVIEAALLRAASGASVPVPEVVASGDATSEMGSAFVIMRHVDGETLPKRVQRQVLETGTGSALAAQCGRILAAVHSIDAATLPGLAGGDPLEQLRGLLDHLGQPHPAFELAIGYLASARPLRSGDSVVHGDFRLGNLIVGAEGIRAVLDWELAHRGDPLEDLGWLCVKAWRFGAKGVVGGFGGLDDLVDSYEQHAMVSVDRQALSWWVVLGTLRWGVICIVQTMTHLSGALPSVDLAAIGRRVCEVEWDLLELLP